MDLVVPPAYRVHVETYEGPLDLLLYLVRRNEVEVTELPVQVLTRQFLQFLELLQELDLETIGEFIVLASTLVEIKSRQVLPSSDETTADEETPLADDPRSELIDRLLEYRRYKEASIALEEQASQWQRRYPRLSVERPTSGKDHAADAIKEVELWDLVSALSRVLQRHVTERQSRIQYDETPISVYTERIRTRVAQTGRVPFSEFFAGTRERSRIIGVFLAILELLRHHGYRAEQPDGRGEIFVLPPGEKMTTEEPASETPDEKSSESA